MLDNPRKSGTPLDLKAMKILTDNGFWMVSSRRYLCPASEAQKVEVDIDPGKGIWR